MSFKMTHLMFVGVWSAGSDSVALQSCCPPFMGAWSIACWIGRSTAKYQTSARIVPRIARQIMNITSFFSASDC